MTEDVMETLPDQTAAPITDPTPPAETSETLLDNPGESTTTVPADWPEDWRARLADGDDKALKALERYQSPKDVARALREAHVKISKGIKSDLPADATEEQVTAWRKENGIPDKADGYLEKLPDGLVVGEDDKPLIGTFLDAMHSKNVKPEVVGAALDWYYGMQDAQAAEQVKSDNEFKRESEDALRAEWGGEYRANINAAMAFLDAAPADGDVSLKGLLLGARLADGTPLGNNPLALRWLAGLANEANPAGFISPAGGQTQIKSVEDRIKQIEDTMLSNRATYDKDTAMQAEYLKLLGARDRLSARA